MWIWDVTVRLDEARTTAGELAVLRERLRFSADLHDVQGHHLLAISLKAELTRRLIGTDDDAARGHAADVQELTLSALAETRALVREGATNLLRHARAGRCTLSVQLEGDEVVLRVQDDGLQRERPDDGGDPGTGVLALRERFAAVGGRVEAAPRPGRGFALIGRAPR
jgi:two-component system sensor histidine kinase DesK